MGGLAGDLRRSQSCPVGALSYTLLGTTKERTIRQWIDNMLRESRVVFTCGGVPSPSLGSLSGATLPTRRGADPGTSVHTTVAESPVIEEEELDPLDLGRAAAGETRAAYTLVGVAGQEQEQEEEVREDVGVAAEVQDPPPIEEEADAAGGGAAAAPLDPDEVEVQMFVLK